MPCTTPNCPAELTSAPRHYHAPECPRAASRSGKSGGQPDRVRVRPDIADELRRIKDDDLEDEAVAALRATRKP